MFYVPSSYDQSMSLSICSCVHCLKFALYGYIVIEVVLSIHLLPFLSCNPLTNHKVYMY